MSSESGLNVDGAVLSWSIIPSGQYWLKSNRLEMMPIPRQNVFQTYIIPSRVSRKYNIYGFWKYIFSIFGYIFWIFQIFSDLNFDHK